MSDLKFEAVGVLGQGMISALFATTRFRRNGEDHYLRFRRRSEPVIFVFWHGQLLPLVYAHKNEGIVVLVSEHADGEYLTRVTDNLGFTAVRGSSTRGGTRAMKGMIRAARAGRDLALTPDGPKGPRGHFKPGALAVAQATGLPVIGVGVGASGGWRFRSWDGFLVPRPLSRIHIEYAPPRFVDRDATREELEILTGEMGAEIDGLIAEAERKAGS